MKFDYRRHPDPEYRFFLYDPWGDGFMFFRSAEERDAAARDAIAAYLDDVWDEGVENVLAGEVTHHTIPTNVTMKPKREDFDSEEDFEDALAEFGDSDCDYVCNYELRPLGTTPATINELRPLTESSEPVGDDHDLPN